MGWASFRRYGRQFILIAVLVVFLIFLPLAVSSSEDTGVDTVWDFYTEETIKKVRISENGQYVLALSQQNNLYLYSLEGALIWSARNENGYVSVDVSGDGSCVATGSADAFVNLYGIDGTKLWSQHVNGSIVSVDITNDGERISVVTIDSGVERAGLKDSTVSVFDKAGTRLWQQNVAGTAAQVSISDISKDVLVISTDQSETGINQAKISLFNSSGNQTWGKDPGETTAEQCRITSDGRYIALKTADGGVYSFDRNGTLLWHQVIEDAGEIDISDRSGYVLVSSYNYLYLFDPAGAQVWKQKSNIFGSDITKISGNDEYIVSTTNDYFKNSGINSVNMADLAGNALWQHDFNENVISCDISGDGRYVAVSQSHYSYGWGGSSNITLLKNIAAFNSTSIISNTTTPGSGSNGSLSGIVGTSNQSGLGPVASNNSSNSSGTDAGSTSPPGNSGLAGELFYYGAGAAGILVLLAGALLVARKARTEVTPSIVLGTRDVLEDEHIEVPVNVSIPDKKIKISGTVRLSDTTVGSFDGPGKVSLNLGKLAPGNYALHVDYVTRHGRKESKGVITNDFRVLQLNPLSSSKYVFLSYADQDRDIAESVCHRLEEHGVKCWIAPRDIPQGVPPQKAIVSAINGSLLLIIIFSSHANRSQYIDNNVRAAWKRGIPIIPFRIEDVPMNDILSYYISAVHAVNASDHLVEEHVDSLARLVNVLMSDIGEHPGSGENR